MADDILLYSGLPKVTDFGPVDFFYEDIMNRTYINISNQSWCIFDDYFYEYCGGTPRANYFYCIYMDQWPHPNLREWLNETVMASPSSIDPQVPAFCACPNGDVAVWIPYAPHLGVSYDAPCAGEHVLLALNCLLLVFLTILLVVALLEVLMWTLRFIVKENVLTIASTYLPKVFVFLCIILGIAVLCITMQPGYSAGLEQRYRYALAYAWTLAFSFFFLSLAYLWWLFAFVRVTTRIRDITATSKIWDFGFIVFATIVTVLIVAIICLTGAIYNQTLILVGIQNIPAKGPYFDTILSLQRALQILALAALFANLIWGTILVIKSGYDYLQSQSSEVDKLVKDKCVYNLIATIFLWLVFGCFLAYHIVLTWQIRSDYQINIAFGWLNFALFSLALVVLFCITMALRTRFEEGGYLSNLVKTNVELTSSASSRGGAGSGSTDRRVSSGRVKSSGRVNSSGRVA